MEVYCEIGRLLNVLFVVCCCNGCFSHIPFLLFFSISFPLENCRRTISMQRCLASGKSILDLLPVGHSAHLIEACVIEPKRLWKSFDHIVTQVVFHGKIPLLSGVYNLSHFPKNWQRKLFFFSFHLFLSLCLSLSISLSKSLNL